MDAMCAILICDDDADTRAALRRALRGHHVTEAESPIEGLAALRAASFDAVMSDFDFGSSDQGDGLAFLQAVRVQWPATLRFLVTGNADVQVAARAVNSGAVDRYIMKPWSPDTLRTAIEIALHARVSGDPGRVTPDPR